MDLSTYNGSVLIMATDEKSSKYLPIHTVLSLSSTDRSIRSNITV